MNSANASGRTTPMCACIYNYEEVVETLLLTESLEVDAVCHNGLSTSMVYIIRGSTYKAIIVEKLCRTRYRFECKTQLGQDRSRSTEGTSN